LTTQNNILDLAVLVQRLRAADSQRRVFGSAHHRYRVGPALSEGELTAFESAHRVKLPDDYRHFLATVGNGGAGPFYGLEPLSSFGRDLAEPFPLTQATDALTEKEQAQLPDRDNYGGVLEFCHQGCGIYSYLVVNGSTYGTIWDGGEEFYPTGLSFSAWYRSWLERALLALENEHLVSRLRVGMSRSEVVAEVAADWRARQALGRSVLYFEAPNIPVQLELDDRDFVVKINPSSFILARPC
jgi:hypothetical protein